jgi:hypothetical protein
MSFRCGALFQLTLGRLALPLVLRLLNKTVICALTILSPIHREGVLWTRAHVSILSETVFGDIIVEG